MKQEIVRFDELRFQHGKIEYDVLMRSKLEALNAERALSQSMHRIAEIRANLNLAILP